MRNVLADRTIISLRPGVGEDAQQALRVRADLVQQARHENETRAGCGTGAGDRRGLGKVPNGFSRAVHGATAGVGYDPAADGHAFAAARAFGDAALERYDDLAAGCDFRAWERRRAAEKCGQRDSLPNRTIRGRGRTA